MDLATLTNTPRTLTVDGRDYRIHPLTLNDLGELQEWVNTQLPDPVEAIADSPGFKRLPPEAQKYAIRCAVELASKGKRRLGSPEATELINSTDGVCQLLFLTIKRGDPAFTQDDARKLSGCLTPRHI